MCKCTSLSSKVSSRACVSDSLLFYRIFFVCLLLLWLCTNNAVFSSDQNGERITCKCKICSKNRLKRMSLFTTNIFLCNCYSYNKIRDTLKAQNKAKVRADTHSKCVYTLFSCYFFHKLGHQNLSIAQLKSIVIL